MSTREKKTWLVCYDIREPKRLRRVHRSLRKEGATVQYSAFSVYGSDADMRRILDRLLLLIDERADDLRAYHLPERCQVWTLGVQHLPDNVFLDATSASRLLLANAETAESSADASPKADDLSFL